MAQNDVCIVIIHPPISQIKPQLECDEQQAGASKKQDVAHETFSLYFSSSFVAFSFSEERRLAILVIAYKPAKTANQIPAKIGVLCM